MLSQIFLTIRMALLYPAFSMLTFNGFTSFDPDTGQYIIQVDNLWQALFGPGGYVLTWIGSRIGKGFDWAT